MSATSSPSSGCPRGRRPRRTPTNTAWCRRLSPDEGRRDRGQNYPSGDLVTSPHVLGRPRSLASWSSLTNELTDAGRSGTMTSKQYDVIVVGARCAGSPTGMLLARKGYRVLVVDKATFPSDTLSTHMIHPPGVAALRRWGLLDRVTATGCPPVHTYQFDFGPVVISGVPGTP